MWDFIHEKERARVRIDFEVDGTKFKAGEWVEGQFVYAGARELRFDTGTLLIVPDYFDKFELHAFTLEETFGMDLGKASDRDDDDDDFFGDEDEDR